MIPHTFECSHDPVHFLVCPWSTTLFSVSMFHPTFVGFCDPRHFWVFPWSTTLLSASMIHHTFECFHDPPHLLVCHDPPHLLVCPWSATRFSVFMIHPTFSVSMIHHTFFVCFHDPPHFWVFPCSTTLFLVCPWPTSLFGSDRGCWIVHRWWKTQAWRWLYCNVMMMKCCLMSSDVSWHIRDKLRPMPKNGSVNLYVHGNQKAC